MWRIGFLACFSTLLIGADDALPARAVAVLQANCSGCHGESAAMSGLRLSSRDQALKGGTRGPAITPGDAKQSRLYLAVTHAAEPSMPPGKSLETGDIETIRQWIDSGARWPAAKLSSWWSFQKPKRVAVPALNVAWVRTPIDAFILAKLNEKNLNAAPEADRFTLIRRATFDLHGLPPTAEEARSFIGDSSPNAYEKLIDRLLASPRYGEKWGRHWLDLVRYGDTAGFEQDPYILEAWRYRDWVINALNSDKPYDRFVKEQIAGDELFPDDADARSGTGMYCVGPNRDMLFKVEDQNRVEVLTDYVDTTSSVFLGLTVGCARCHDHKFDPIPQRDYYRMRAIFEPAVKTRVFLEYNEARGYDLAENRREIKLRQIADEITRIQSPYRKALLDKKLASAPAKLREAFLTDGPKRTPEQVELVSGAAGRAYRIGDDDIRAALSQADTERLHAIEKRLVSMFAGYKPPPMSPGITDIGPESPHTYIAPRGNWQMRGDLVGPGFLSVLGGGDVPVEPPPDAVTTLRRKALAEWIATPDNPLTARVMVNRVWQGHFGRGLVGTPSDYGVRGEAPSHPELLDWLANEFVAQGWSLKKLHRTIMLSSVYRQSSVGGSKQDPQNLYLSHYNRRRLQSEEIRDSMLAGAGALNMKMGGIPVVPPLDDNELYGIIGDPSDAWVVTSDKTEHTRRSVYLISRRAFRSPMQEVFDSPDGNAPCPRRESSTIAPQSLTLLNGRFTIEQSKLLADALLKKPAPERIAHAWRQVLSRPPSDLETGAATDLLAAQAKITGSEPAALAELVRGLFNLNEFLYVD